MGHEDMLPYDNMPESPTLVNFICNRFRKGLYTLSLIIGLPGTGKSYSSIRLSELVYQKLFPDEDREIVIIDSLLQLIEFVRKAKPGDCAVIEEMSVLFPSRRAMSIENVEIGRILDTCRKKRVILFANAPLFNTIDSHIQALANVTIETLKVVKTKKVVVTKALVVQVNVNSGKAYRKYMVSPEGYEVNRSIIRKPDDEILERYEKRKDDFMDYLYLKMRNKQVVKKAKEEKENNKYLGLRDPVHDPEKAMVWKQHKAGKSLRAIGNLMNRSPNTISRWIMNMKESGTME